MLNISSIFVYISPFFSLSLFEITLSKVFLRHILLVNELYICGNAFIVQDAVSHEIKIREE